MQGSHYLAIIHSDEVSGYLLSMSIYCNTKPSGSIGYRSAGPQTHITQEELSSHAKSLYHCLRSQLKVPEKEKGVPFIVLWQTSFKIICLLERPSERDRKGEREIINPLIHFLLVSNSQGWLMPKLIREFPQDLPCRDSSTCTIINCLTGSWISFVGFACLHSTVISDVLGSFWCLITYPWINDHWLLS